MYPQIELTEDAGVIFSSGTTGDPKAIMRNSYSILSEAIQWIIELQLHIGSTFLIPRPLYYTGGFILMYAVLFSGGRADLLDDTSCNSILNYLQNKMIDWAFIVPSIIREMNILDNNVKINVSCILTMGSPIFHADKTKFHKKYGCNIVEVWGNSEGLGTITSASDLYSHPNSIGRPFFTDYLEIDHENDSTSYNQKGTLYGISDNRFTEYIGKQKLTNYVLHDGYIYSEDIGYKDSNGYFYLAGRKTDIIVVNGMKVFPADIEAEIMKNKEIIDCSVIGIPDEHNNDMIVAVLVVSKTCIFNNIIQKVNNNLAPHEKIQLHILVNKIPRNHGGKPNKNILIKLINEQFRGVK